MAQKVTLAGNIIVDNVKTITAWPEKGMLVPITSVKRSPGGAVPNSGIDLKTLDPSVEVAAFGKVGDDDAGDFVRNFMSERGLDVSNVKNVSGAPTTFTDVMTVASTGERTFFNMHGADSALVPEDVDPAKLGCDIFHLGYLLLLDGLDADLQTQGQGSLLNPFLTGVGAATPVNADAQRRNAQRKGNVAIGGAGFSDYLRNARVFTQDLLADPCHFFNLVKIYLPHAGTLADSCHLKIDTAIFRLLKDPFKSLFHDFKAFNVVRAIFAKHRRRLGNRVDRGSARYHTNVIGCFTVADFGDLYLVNLADYF